MTPDEWNAMPEALFVQFTPDEFCEETECYLGGGERFWFGHSTAHYRGDGDPWHLTAGLNERGLAVRTELQRREGKDG